MANPALDPVTEAFVLTYGWFYWVRRFPFASLPEENGEFICLQGFFFSAVAYGVTLVQTWLYANDNEDGWPMRTFVSLIFFLNHRHTVY